jgi:hypothetical protein
LQIVAVEPKQQEYQAMLNELKHSFVKFIDLVTKLYQIGIKCGLSKEQIKYDVEKILEGIVKPRQLRAILPLELKRKYTINNDNKDNKEGNRQRTAKSKTLKFQGVISSYLLRTTLTCTFLVFRLE